MPSETGVSGSSIMVAWVVRSAGVMFLVYVIYLARPGSSLFSWHPVLMTLAFTGLMSEGVTLFTKYSVGSGQPHRTKVTAHWLIMAATGAAHGLGYAAIYTTKETKEKPHLTTWHGLLGFVTSIVLWFQLLFGVFAKYPKLIECLGSQRSVRARHSLAGTVTFMLGMVTVCLALWSAWFQSNANAFVFYPALGLHIVLLCIVCKRHFVRYVWTGK